MAASNALPTASAITLVQFHSTLARYPSLIKHLATQEANKPRQKEGASDELLRLDKMRYEELPGRGRVSMGKLEVQDAMKWKLKHGKFRPQLLALVAKNNEAAVQETTQEAFTLYMTDPTDYQTPLKVLAELKGIGPATASLLLSIIDGDNVPFFSDELFRWVCWDPKEGWAKKIKYNVKEYEILWESVKSLRERLGEGVRAVDLEKVAFVCGKLGENPNMEADIESAGLVG